MILNQQAYHAELPLFAQAGVEGLESRISETKTAEISRRRWWRNCPSVAKAVDEAVSLYLFFQKNLG